MGTKFNWWSFLGIFGMALGFGSTIVGSACQKHSMEETVRTMVDEALKNQE